MAKKRTTRPTAKPANPRINYTPKLAARLVELVENGETLRSIDAMDGLQSKDAIRRWCRDNEEFRMRINRAREEAADDFESQMLEVAKTAIDAESAAAARVRIGTLRWIAERRAPKRYSSKLDLNHSSELGLRALTDSQLDEKLLALETTATLPG